MTIHKVTSQTLFLPDGKTAFIKYWSEDNTICVAAFDQNDQIISVATYMAAVDDADSFSSAFQQSLIEGLVRTIEYDFKNNPELHIRKR